MGQNSGFLGANCRTRVPTGSRHQGPEQGMRHHVGRQIDIVGVISIGGCGLHQRGKIRRCRATDRLANVTAQQAAKCRQRHSWRGAWSARFLVTHRRPGPHGPRSGWLQPPQSVVMPAAITIYGQTCTKTEFVSQTVLRPDTRGACPMFQGTHSAGDFKCSCIAIVASKVLCKKPQVYYYSPLI